MKFCEKIANIEKIHHSGTKIAVRSLNCLNKLQKTNARKHDFWTYNLLEEYQKTPVLYKARTY